MSILKLLHVHADLENRSIQDITESEIIRIEKKLKADVKLGQNLDLNEVEMILLMLRDHKEELKTLYHPWYRKMREILMNPKVFCVSTQVEVFSFSHDDKFNDFFSKFFGKILTEYTSACIQQDHYNALNTVLLYREILPAGLLDDLAKKSKQKIEFGTECINVKSQNINTKLECLTNPFFYRCLNKLGGVEFENVLIDLLNTSIENLQKFNRPLFLRFLYAAGFFEPVRSDLKTVFRDNQNMAYLKGIREKKYVGERGDQKGGSYQTTSSSFSSNESYREKSKSGWGAGAGAFGGGVVIVLIVLKVLVFGARMGSKNDYQMPDRFDMPTYYDDVNSGVNGDYDSMLCFINEKAMYMQNENLEVINQDDIDFRIGETNFMGAYEWGMEKNLTFTNNTAQPVIILFDNIGTIFLDVDESESTSSLNHRFAVYTGMGPQIVEYRDSLGQKKEDFRFRYFTKSDEETLVRIYDFPNLSSNESHTIEITDENSFIEVNLLTTDELILNEAYDLE